MGEDCSVALDSSGESLHKRGYRSGGQHEAPLNEVLAATLVRLSGWDGQSNFTDPMCGSGTIVTEAALFAMKIAPGLLRNYFGFKQWSDFNAPLWEKLCAEAETQINHDWEYTVYGSDMEEKYVQLAMDSAEKTGTDEVIKLKTKRFEEAMPPAGSGVAVFNPPYGERLMGGNNAVNELYKTIGDTLKKNYEGYDVWILSSNMEAIKHIGLRPSRKISLFNGSLECKFLKFSIYKGSLKAKYQEQNPK
jgi:putative N6-adenine-specific DNA methylase